MFASMQDMSVLTRVLLLIHIFTHFFFGFFKACYLKPTHVFIFWLFGSFRIQINDVQCFVKWPVGMNVSRNVWIATMQMYKCSRNSALKLSSRERAESGSLLCSAPFWRLQEPKLVTLRIRWDGKANQALLCNIVRVLVVQRATLKCMLNPRLWLPKGGVFCCKIWNWSFL